MPKKCKQRKLEGGRRRGGGGKGGIEGGGFANEEELSPKQIKSDRHVVWRTKELLNGEELQSSHPLFPVQRVQLQKSKSRRYFSKRKREEETFELKNHHHHFIICKSNNEYNANFNNPLTIGLPASFPPTLNINNKRVEIRSKQMAFRRPSLAENPKESQVGSRMMYCQSDDTS